MIMPFVSISLSLLAGLRVETLHSMFPRHYITNIHGVSHRFQQLHVVK